MPHRVVGDASRNLSGQTTSGKGGLACGRDNNAYIFLLHFQRGRGGYNPHNPLLPTPLGLGAPWRLGAPGGRQVRQPLNPPLHNRLSARPLDHVNYF